MSPGFMACTATLGAISVRARWNWGRE
jgi:hypothetical protein